jgi:hypothetical protein
MNPSNLVLFSSASTAILSVGACFAEAAIAITKRKARAQLHPNNLVIITPSVNGTLKTLYAKLNFPRSLILHECVSDEEEIIDATRNHVETKGTLDELVIDTHGRKNAFVIKGAESKTDVEAFLHHLLSEQRRLHIQITKRIIFVSCNMFANLSHERVKAYQNMAYQLNTEIVGSTTLYVGGPFYAGRMTRFRPDGKIDRDIYDRPFNYMSRMVQILSWLDGYSSSWMKDFVSPQNFQNKSPLRRVQERHAPQPRTRSELM